MDSNIKQLIDTGDTRFKKRDAFVVFSQLLKPSTLVAFLKNLL